METKWLEDFISLAETRSFSRSAELRHVTQPAFSRRIQSLEAWLGADLIDRTSYPTSLTPSGEVFYEQALEMLEQVNNARAMLRGKRPTAQTTVDFAMPHTLSLTYMPKWLTRLEAGFGSLNTRLIALNVHDAAMALVEGGCDLLLCYHHPRQPVQLDASRYDMLLLGSEALRPYSRCDKSGTPEYVLPGTAQEPLPFLSYTSNAYLGRMVELAPGDQLYDDPKHPYTKALLTAVPIADPKRARERNIDALTGEIPSPINPPSGCTFRTRCRYAIGLCAEKRPLLEGAGEGRLVACHRWQEIDHMPGMESAAERV